MKKFKGFGKSFIIWTLIFMAVFAISQVTYAPQDTQKTEDIPYSEFTEKVNAGQVYAVKMQGQQILGTYKDATKFKTYVPNNAKIVELLEKHKIKISAEPEEDPESGWFSAP